MRNTLRLARVLGASLALAPMLSCGASPEGPSSPETEGASVDARALSSEEPPGLSLRLSEGSTETADVSVPVARGERLEEREADRLFTRLPPLPAVSGEAKAPALRPSPPPPPRPGEVERAPLPPPAGEPPAPQAPGRLEVVRYAPSGDVPLARHIGVTFNQPMVPVTSHRGSLEHEPPLRIEPRPEGRFRWVGSRTLLFEPEGRFPMASDFRATVPAGTRAESGAPLEAEVSFSLSTPPPGLVERYPEGQTVRSAPLVFLRFDQRVDPARVAGTTAFRSGDEEIGARLATAEEIASDRAVAKRVESAALRDRVAVLAPSRALPADARIEVRVGPGTPSLEGPKRTEAAQVFGFRTFGALEAREHECGFGGTCRPGQPLRIRFSNPLRPGSVRALELRADPPIPGLRARAVGEWLNLEGATEGRTKYAVTIPAGLEDTFGQKLAAPSTRTFEVGPAEPRLVGPQGMTVADPGLERPAYVFHSVNVPSVEVAVYRVSPSDWEAFVAYSSRGPRASEAPAPGAEVFRETVDIAGGDDALVSTEIDLSPALDGARGHAVVVVEPTRWESRYPPTIRAWVQVTEIGLAAFVDGEGLLAWATELSTGRSMNGLSIELVGGAATKTDSDGLARLDLPREGDAQAALLVARRGRDSAFLPAGGGFPRPLRGGAGEDRIVWYVFDDRRTYRPGETVHVKGWVRRVDLGKGGDVEALERDAREVGWTLYGPRGNEIERGRAKLSSLGGFHAELVLPDTPNLGMARLELRLENEPSAVHHHGFQIQEFRRPEYEVETRPSAGPYVVGEGASVTAEARYYAGGALRAAPLEWRVTATEAHFQPPNRGDYVFGRHRSVWGPAFSRSRRVRPEVSTFEGETDARGRHALALDFLSADPPLPARVVAEAIVTDVNRQAWADRSTLLVHPSEVYVGLKSARNFVAKGEPIEVEVIVVDHEGELAPGRGVELVAKRTDSLFGSEPEGGSARASQRCVVESGEAPSRCRFETPEGGAYRIEAVARDARGRPSLTELTTWVSGGPLPPERRLAREEIVLVADADEYAPGETAKILVQAPFHPAEALVTTRRAGLLTSERVTLESRVTTLEVPIDDSHFPSVVVQVDLVGAAPRASAAGEPIPGAPLRPAFAQGEVRLSVPPEERRLSVSVTPAEAALAPGGETELAFEVRDRRGAPVKGAEIAVVVVDEAVLALSGAELTDPLGIFHPDRGAGVRDHHVRAALELAAPADGEVMGLGMGGDGSPVATKRMTLEAAAAEESASAAGPIALRRDFSPLALFEPKVRTGARGEATLRVKVPDNLTRYRIIAVAAHGEAMFGIGESSLTARMPLMVRPSPPRFANFGDAFELPVVVQNQTDAPLEVSVGLRARNLRLLEGRGRRVTVPANDRVELRFPSETERTGEAHFQIAAASGGIADAASGSLPVYAPATTEAFATYGELDRGVARQAVSAPRDAFEGFGGLEITTSSTQLQALTDAVLYLARHPFEWAEQLASRVMAVAALRDALESFAAEGMPPRGELEAAVLRDLELLASLQNRDGGFAYWGRGGESWPWVSVHAANALVAARAAGFEVPGRVMDRALSYVASVDERIADRHPESARNQVRAYALFTLAQAGIEIGREAAALIERVGHESLGVESLGFLLSVLGRDESAQAEAAAIVRFLENRVSETAGGATFATRYEDGAHLVLASSRRADAIVLEALVSAAPASDLIPKLARGLLAHRTKGRWSNTQENVFVLRALGAYFDAYEAVDPSFTARVWLGEGLAATQRFRGRDVVSRLLEVPMRHLVEHPSGVTIEKEGDGRLYYRIGMRYAPESLKLAPEEHGFAVDRVYEAVDDPADVSRGDDGAWTIRSGARVRVRLSMVAPARRHHVALVDALPAGLEPLNPVLAATETPPASGGGEARPLGWWIGRWYEHQSMRDERVEVFATLLPAGVYEYVYITRATTPGRFVVPPAKAEEMYAPETFGRSGSDLVIVAAP